MRALPALSGRVVIAVLERAGFEVISTKGSHRFLRHRDDPSRRRSWPFIGTISRPECFVRYCARPASAGARFLGLLRAIARAFRRGGAEAGGCFLRGGKDHPLPTLPHRGGGLQGEAPLHRIDALAVVATRVVREKPSPLMGEGLGGGDAAELGGDRRMHAVEIFQDLVVPEP
jgi:hypothetical protein